MIPHDINGWTLPVIEALLHQCVFESDLFDFKAKLPHPGDRAGKLRLAKTCAAFANSSGGFLIFGVRDDRGLAPAMRLDGIDPAEDFPERFGNFPAEAEPSVAWTHKNPPIQLPSGRFVHVVHIPASARKPHGLLDDERWSFCKRTSKGTEGMSFEEVRGLFLDASRRENELAYLRAEVERIRELARTLNALSSSQGWTPDMLLSRFDAGPLRTLLVSIFAFIGHNKQAVVDLNHLIDRCRASDSVLAHVAAHQMAPRDRSFSRTGTDPLNLLHQQLPQIVMSADSVLNVLTSIVATGLRGYR